MAKGGDWIAGEVFVPKGSRMPQSKGTPGTDRAILFDANGNLQGPTEFRAGPGSQKAPHETPLGSGSSSAIRDIGATIAVEVLTQLAIQAAPHVSRFWKESILPSIRAKWSSFSARTGRSNPPATKRFILDPPTPAAFSQAISEALEDNSTGMSAAEARERLLAMMVAAAFIAEQMRELSGTHIDDGDAEELKSAMQKLDSPQTAQIVNDILADRSEVIDDNVARDFVRIFGGDSQLESSFKPLTVEVIHETLSLEGDSSRSLESPERTETDASAPDNS